ncbi:CDP-glycerol glycerophosphotransferase family protein [Bacillus sp. USDA818B3_A]|uniref:CDP-glycerol glycerophosphotransferase family protein n=1 Tax=Bacillus sp. USDA818B3_A TaxID=2698834 RepID=UPI001F2BDEBF|nr:CDP-glycerol glycerophosphotransferase family protein [Bacillus sp. USDA818B3_A]
MKRILTNGTFGLVHLSRFNVLEIKEVVIATYLLLFKCVFFFFSLSPQKQKVVFVVSFEENAYYIHQEMVMRNVPFEIVFLCKPSLLKNLQSKLPDTKIIPFEAPKVFFWFQSIYHLATAKVVIVDNYFAFLSSIKFKRNVECFQVWHAAGALKKFGLKDKSTSNRRNAAIKRFKKVYEKFNKIVVGSEEMADIFMECFDVPSENILRMGIPRTDFFYEEDNQEKVKSLLYKEHPFLKDKKVILYAPTFRDTQLDHFKFELDIEKMYSELKEDYVLLIKLHPAVKYNSDLQTLYPEFLYDFSKYKGINELLVVTDYLITDYSSIPFEFALLNKPMIFYPYDLEEYQLQRGVIPNYIEQVPGPVVFKTEEIINRLKRDQFDLGQVYEFSNRWNRYSNGKSSGNLVQYIIAQLEVAPASQVNQLDVTPTGKSIWR